MRRFLYWYENLPIERSFSLLRFFDIKLLSKIQGVSKNLT